MIFPDFAGITLKLRKAEGKTTVFDPVRKIWVALTPEEHVRQYILIYLLETMKYPASLVAVEKNILVNNRNRRFDIVVYNREHKPWLLAECKAPEVAITEHTLHQLLHYQQTTGCTYWLLTNGRQTLCADATDIQDITWLLSLPAYKL